MARIPYPDLESGPARQVADEIRATRNGSLLNVDRMLLHRPDFAQASRGLFKVVRTQFDISNRIRELISVRVAVLNRADYELAQHERFAAQAGYSSEQIAQLKQESPNPGHFDAGENLVIRLADMMTLYVQVDDELFNAVLAQFGQRQTVELVSTVASYNYISRFLEVLQVDVE
jgi:AhpD family alkylhydroperoxidase